MPGSHLRRVAVAAGLALTVALPGVATANHSWGGYHWARTANPFTLALGDNVDSSWDAYLGTTSSDWSQSKVLDTEETFSFTFGKAGTYQYFCSIHPKMTGKVVVQ